MGLFKRLLGICATKKPADEGCWSVSGGSLQIDLERVPELKQKGSAVRLEGKNLPVRVLVVRGDDDAFHAFKNKCTHAGRRIDPLLGKNSVQCCSLGKSTFDYSGKPISGSAKKNLTVLPVEAQGGKVVVRLR
jgi:nitrite reductase/ring-hydroxylating ferredoxin subunit